MTDTALVHARVTRQLRASAEDVFDAWLDADLARRWFGAGLGEMTRVEIDARVGGTFWLVQRRGEVDAAHTGEYLEIDRPRRLAFTWRMPPDTERSRVIVDVAAATDGCVVTVVHEMDAKWAEFVDEAATAWGSMTDLIDHLVGDRRRP